jgi:catechol 2,3-dioxygenase-like lactoylglutathione lyase family enzyme
VSALVPELYVSSLGRSLSFYLDLLGFVVEYDRPEERFASIALGSARIMLEEEWRTAELRQPFGRGVNLQVEVPDVARICSRLSAASYPLLLAPYERSYRVGRESLIVRQMLVADPDGYLIRPSQTLERSPTFSR